MELKEYPHTPPHLFLPNTKYFITASTYNRELFLKEDFVKQFVLDSLDKGFKSRNWTIEDWVILDNHYHLMVNSGANADILPAIMKEVHKFTALWIKKNVLEARTAKKIWYNYWDTCITYEKSYFARLNYIWYNPAKHGYVEKPEDWIYGSYIKRFKTEIDYLVSINKNYPFEKVNVKDDF